MNDEYDDARAKYTKDSYYSPWNNDRSIDDLIKEMYGDSFDDYFKEFLNNSHQSEFHYQRESHKTFTPKIDNSIDNSYKLMSLNKDDDEKTIKKRYRELSMKWHPDKFQNDTTENQGIATRNFTKLNNAYELIKKHKNFN